MTTELKPIPQDVRADPEQLDFYLHSIGVEEVIKLVNAGFLSPDAVGYDSSKPEGARITDPIMRRAVLEASQEHRRQQAEQQALEALPDDLAIVPVLMGHDDPYAILAELGDVPEGYEKSYQFQHEMPEGIIELANDGSDPEAYERALELAHWDWAMVDGYMYVRGVTTNQLEAAVLKVRPKPEG